MVLEGGEKTEGGVTRRKKNPKSGVKSEMRERKQEVRRDQPGGEKSDADDHVATVKQNLNSSNKKRKRPRRVPEARKVRTSAAKGSGNRHIQAEWK